MASLSKSNGRFIKASHQRIKAGPDGQFIKVNSNQEGHRRPNPLLRRTSSLSTAGRPQWPVYRPAPTGRANPQIWPLKAQFAIAPHKQFINGRSATVFIQAGPVAILSKPIIMAILSKSNGCFINAPRSGLGGPIRYCAAQAVYQRLAGPDGQFIKASSDRKGQPPDLAFEGPIRHCAA